MMRRSCWIVVVTLGGLLALATSASAECAWVLWARSMSYPPNKWTVWEFQAVFTTADKCVADLAQQKATARDAKQAGRPVSIVEHASQLLVDYRDLQSKFEFICIPDTLKPERMGRPSE